MTDHVAGPTVRVAGPSHETVPRRGAALNPPTFGVGATAACFVGMASPCSAWRHALHDACRKAGVPHRLLHDCRRTAARNLIRAGVPERIAMLLTGHKTRAVFDRYNIVNERELLSAGERLAAYLGDRTSLA